MGDQLLALGTTWAWSAAKLSACLHEQAEGWHHPVVFGLLGAVAGATGRPIDPSTPIEEGIAHFVKWYRGYYR